MPDVATSRGSGSTPVLDSLSEEHNPGARLRTLVELCGLPADDAGGDAAHELVVRTLLTAHCLPWMDGSGIKPVDSLAALAEYGLAREDVRLGPVVDRRFSVPSDANCGAYMLRRALVMRISPSNSGTKTCAARARRRRASETARGAQQ
jgi:hypothetical protein